VGAPEETALDQTNRSGGSTEPDEQTHSPQQRCLPPRSEDTGHPAPNLVMVRWPTRRQSAQIARELGMSVSGLHHHFKAVTALSPLQFQKRLQLLEARRLMLDEDLDAARAAYRVGYHDASHFNREYKRHFGVPPMRDVHRLRAQDKLSTSTIISVRNNARFDADQASAAG